MVGRKRALGIKAGRLAQEEWNLAAIGLEPTTCPWGEKAKGEQMPSARARRAPEPNGHEEMVPNS